MEKWTGILLDTPAHNCAGPPVIAEDRERKGAVHTTARCACRTPSYGVPLTLSGEVIASTYRPK